ncbi:S-layer homology domain-containing protein [Candidatus Peregrinibacteria bacterium]|nr:S-layer homology domain-containing protein [Candidatus Peregrinibacteria bacterium]
MKSKKNILGLAAAVMLFQATGAAALAFSDVPADYQYSTAILYLKANNIVDGYSDGTFKAENTISRVEFLKIIMEGTGVELDSLISMNFSDTPDNQWYSPYVKKAFAEGWIEGYPDGTFKPGNPINKAEALKILGEVQNWDRPAHGGVPVAPYFDTPRYAWYSPYVYFAKENDLLPDQDEYLYPRENVLRGYMSEIVYRSIINDVSNYEPAKTAEKIINEVPTVENPSTFSIINADYFDKIKLNSPIPNCFYLNEIYLFEGEIIDAKNYDMIFAFLSENINGQNIYRHFLGKIDGSKFVIPVIFNKPGTYSIGIIPGNNGESKIADITVLNGIPPTGSTTNPDIPKNLKIDFKNSATNVLWQADSNNVFRVYFIQDNIAEGYFIRNKKNLDIFYKDFWKFKEGNIKWRVYGAKADSIMPLTLTNTWTQSPDGEFNAVMHHYSLSDNNAILTTSIPEELPTSQEIYVSGTTYENIYDEGAVITPDGTIDAFTINTSASKFDFYGYPIIPSGASFNFTYKPQKDGTYILEINSQAGSAVVNTPVYIGNIIPFIPDFFDLQDPLETTKSINLEEVRNELLGYINHDRILNGLNSVSLRSDLNTLAQNHSNDMRIRDFFSHINPDGETPEDRRKELNIKTSVGENLAYAPTVYFGHKALMRSAIHLKNVLNPTWDSVGLGITLDSNGYLLITEEFSHKDWSNADLENFENQILDSINQKRTSNIVLNSTLRDIARNWSSEMIMQNFFSFTSPSGINLIDIVRNSGFTQEGRAFILKEGSYESLAAKLQDESDVLNSVWRNIGLGIQKDEWSALYLTVLYTY